MPWGGLVVVVDQAGDLTDDDRQAVDEFAARMRAEALLVDGTLDPRYPGGDDSDPGDPPADGAGGDPSTLRQQMAQLLQGGSGDQRPPVDTVQGRLARVWGGDRAATQEEVAQ